MRNSRNKRTLYAGTPGQLKLRHLLDGEKAQQRGTEKGHNEGLGQLC